MKKNKIIRYSLEKNEILKKERNIGFEDVILSIENGYLLDDIEHPNKEKYQNQNIFIILVKIKNYVYLVPYVEEEDYIFLKTIIPSRQMNKKYNKGE
jgi:hypothetical protein